MSAAATVHASGSAAAEPIPATHPQATTSGPASAPIGPSIKQDNGEEEYVKGKIKMNDQDFQGMIPHFLAAIEKGHVSAMNDLAFYHHYSTKQAENVIKYYTMAIGNGNMGSAYNFGVLVWRARGLGESNKVVDRLGSGGNVRAAYGLGTIYEEQKEYPRAEEWYWAAWEKGDHKSCIPLVECLLMQPNRTNDAKLILMKGLRQGVADVSYYFDDERLGSLTGAVTRRIVSDHFATVWHLDIAIEING